MYDIDELIEPRKKKQFPRDPFAQLHEQVKEGKGDTYQYDSLGQFYPEPELAREYQKKNKGKEAHIEYMSPNRYFAETRHDIDSFYDKYDEKDRPKIHRYINKLKKSAIAGDKFAMPWIVYEKGKYTGEQEGFHRTVMAKELGVKEIPVTVINKDSTFLDSENWINTRDNFYRNPPKKKQNPFTYEEELI